MTPRAFTLSCRRLFVTKGRLSAAQQIARRLSTTPERYLRWAAGGEAIPRAVVVRVQKELGYTTRPSRAATPPRPPVGTAHA